MGIPSSTLVVGAAYMPSIRTAAVDGGVVASHFIHRYRANLELAFLVRWSDQIYSSLLLGLQVFGYVV
ncbi:MAG: hypothetical protein P9E24_08785 [Candidatus Competibacter sp.]|nr:hypothetical protein [Candidatus Competibacter sp.]MDG4585107.1 hypothetical protein [Candidatus Competibacter sp.]